MPTLFPGSLDSFTSPIATNPLNAPLSHTHAHVDLNDSVEALEAKVGVDGSTVVTSLDYLVRQGVAFVGQTIEWNSASDPPVGVWADEDGRALSRTTYAALFALLGTTWNTFRGQSDPGGTLFRVPWSSGLVAVAAGSAGSAPVTSARTLGSVGGEETHVLIEAEIPAHVHSVALDETNPPGTDPASVKTGQGNQDEYLNTSATGGNGAHQNMQPFAVKRKIIRIL